MVNHFLVDYKEEKIMLGGNHLIWLGLLELQEYSVTIWLISIENNFYLWQK